MGNDDRNTVVYHDLMPPITARYIRFRPVEWNVGIAMRVELYGCRGSVKNFVRSTWKFPLNVLTISCFKSQQNGVSCLCFCICIGQVNV